MKELIVTLCLASLSILLLFCGFYNNQWGVAGKLWFAKFQLDSESRVVRKIETSRQNGIFSDGGLLRGDEKENAVYESQIGGQGILFSIFDRYIRLPNDKKLEIFHWVVSMMTAIILTFVILFFYYQFGPWVFLGVLISTVFSPWIVVFGRNLYWCLGVFFIPMIAVMYFLDHEKRNGEGRNIQLITIIFLCVFIKCFINGYEYITTTLIMMMTPIVYYSVLDQWGLRVFSKRILLAMLSACLAILSTFIILCYQIYCFTGRYEGIQDILFALAKRTYGFCNLIYIPNNYIESLKANPVSVVATYLMGPYHLNHFKISYWQLVLIFFLVSIFYLIRYRYFTVYMDNKRKIIAVICATWFSILAPLSWFVIFKGHSYIHPHMNYITWHMPFTIFGFALCSLFVKDLAYQMYMDFLKKKPDTPA